MSSIYNSDRKIEQFFLGSQEITEMFLGNELVFSKITNNLFYKLHEFVGSLTVQNTIEAPVKSAILCGSTKYKDVDTDEILETFEEGRNLELVSVKMPVLTTSNEDGTKTNILTVNEDVTLRSNGDVYDELNLLTGRLTQRIDENNEVLAQEVVKTVDLTMVDQDEQTISKLNSFNGTTHVSTEVAENGIYPTIAIEVATE